MNIKRAFLQILPGKSLDENFLIGKKACIEAKEKGAFLIYPKKLNLTEEKALNLTYKRATIEDIDILTQTRIEVLKAANKLSDDIDMGEVKKQSYDYYKKALLDGTHIAYLIFEEDRFVGAGGVSFFQIMPTYHNPSGKKAYIMNMYTHTDYRRRGIAYKTLDLLIKDAKSRGITAISLEATDMGRPLYEKYGFVQMRNEMELSE